MAQANADPLVTVWDALERADCRPAGPPHQFHAVCPVHEGDDPDSLSVGTGADARALIHCHVGCDTRDVVRRLGLLWSDLFPAGHKHARRAGALRRRQERPIDVVLLALRELGIEYRCTRDPTMWVAAVCPCCGKAGGWPLWITADDRGRVGFACFNGCDDFRVLEALAGVKQELAS